MTNAATTSAPMDLMKLKQLMESGAFHHATYRNAGTLWEGLWIYKRAPALYRGFQPAGAFFKGSPDLKAAEEMVRGTGISVGSYGHG